MSTNFGTKSYPRSDRAGELVKQNLAKIFLTEFKDPRVGMLSLSTVKMSRDLSNAKVFVTFIDKDLKSEPEKVRTSVKVLNNAASFLRTELASRIRMKKVPSLRFVYDEAQINADNISKLLDAAR